MSLFDLDGPAWGPAAGGRPDALIVLLHGYGADGNDLIGLAPYLAQALPTARFLSPDAPYPGEMGFGRQWFGIGDRSPDHYLAGTRGAAPALDAFLDTQLEAHELSDDRLGLIGFSQGTMMALHVAPRRGNPCAGVVGFSGRLVAPELLAQEVRCRPPFVLVHGDADEVVPHSALGDAARALADAGFDVEAHTRPRLGHSIDPEGMRLAARFLAERLG